MSSPALPRSDARGRFSDAEAALSPTDVVVAVVRAFASLKLTVTLFALGIFVVLVGTLAQQESNIGQVVSNYFHAWVMWVDVNLLFPKMFLPWVPVIEIPAPGFLKSLSGGFITNLHTFPAPGGLFVGSLMAINLLAAHGWRFGIQAKGARLLIGVVVMAIGLAVGVLIVWAGHSSTGFQTKPPFSWEAFWTAFLLGCGMLWCALAFPYAVYGVGSFVRRAQKEPRAFIEIVLLWLLAAPLVGSGWAIGYGFLSGYRPADEAIRIVWQLLQGGLAGLILLVGCILVFRKRGGMVLLHLGIGLLIFNELWVAMTARERQVFLREGQTLNYLRDIREIELAIVDRSSATTDEHVVVPQGDLLDNYEKNVAAKAAEKPLVYIDDPLLPAKFAVLQYFSNSDIEDLKPGDETPATTGRGKQERLVEKRSGKGTDTEGAVDLAGAYVQFADKKSGEPLGTLLLSQFVDFQTLPEKFGEKLQVGDATYDVFLRFKREYKPYTMNLIDVRKDDYVASNTPRNYSSDILIKDDEAGVDEKVHIKMNDPLRYRGDTFYQSNYSPPERPGGTEATTLQVVLNRGWMIPYVACMVVVIGMVAHFLITVTRFVGRREAEELAAGDVIRAEVADAPNTQSRGKKKANAKRQGSGGFDWSAIGLPLLAAGIFTLIVGVAIRPPKSKPEQMNLVGFGQLPVAHMGRIKPLDTLARNSLRALTINSESAKTASGKRVSAVEWLLEVIAGTEASEKMPIIRIDSKEVRRVFDLPDRKGFLFTIEELHPKIAEFETQVRAAQLLDEEKRTVEQRRILELGERLHVYMTLAQAFSAPRLPEVPTEEESKQNPAAIPQFLDEFRAVMADMMSSMNRLKAPRVIPMTLGESKKDEDAWQTYPVAFAMTRLMQLTGQSPNEATVAFSAIVAAYHKNDVPAFNAAVSKYEANLQRQAPPLWSEGRVHQESYFNHASPFFVAMVLYVLAFLVAIFGWLARYRPLNWAAFTLILLTFLFHTVALVLRIYISGRPPVTNLYSAAVFIGWAAVFFGLAIEAIYRLGLGNIVAASAGYASLQVAYLLSSGGDTIAVLQAVLDTQFWLATHVVCITLGYAATYLAGLFGLLYVIAGLCTPLLDKHLRKEIGRIIYGITCFAILFSFFGTVLGGLWADDSWGRFWGWDPKENGALLIVLWNAILLHARWDKMIADRGMAVLAIGGNIVTTWSFFGVNQLGIGLHAYGGSTLTFAIVLDLVALSQLILIGLGCLPTRLWWSYQADTAGDVVDLQVAK